MLGFLIRRIIQAIIVMLAVALIAFMMFRFMGDPVSSMVELPHLQNRADFHLHAGNHVRSRDLCPATCHTEPVQHR